jgi:hypothetical protein
MFIDVCFPNKNEEKFIEIAKKLGTSCLCFVYDSPSKAKMVEDNEIKIFYGFISVKNKESLVFSSNFPQGIFSMKNTVFFIRDFENSKKSFFTPLPLINQVIIKEAYDKGNSLGFGLPLIIKSKSYPKKISQVCFLMRLCKKYGVNVVIASFSYFPYELRSEKELSSIFYNIFKDSCFVNKSLHTLQNLFDNAL